LTIILVLSGVSGAMSGILVASMLGAAAPAALSGTILTVIAAVILGGTSLSGGSGNVWGTLLGVLILGTLTNGLVILNVSSFWQEVVQGLVLLAAVGIDQVRQRKRRE
jgi:ribose transport system permease protein